MALELRAVLRPVAVAQIQRRLVPASAAEIDGSIKPGLLAEPLRHEREAELGVLLPVPVGGKIGELAKALLAAAERIERARLQRGEAHRALERAVGELPFEQIVVGAARHRARAQLRALVDRQRDDRVIAGAHQCGDGFGRRRIREMQVGDDEVITLAREPLECFGECCRDLRAALDRPDRREVLLDDHARSALVLDQQDANAAQHFPLCSCYPSHYGRIPWLQLPGMTPGSCDAQNLAISRGHVNHTRPAERSLQWRSAARSRRRRNGWPKT